jgi:hypothetical protein
VWHRLGLFCVCSLVLVCFFGFCWVVECLLVVHKHAVLAGCECGCMLSELVVGEYALCSFSGGIFTKHG